MFTWSFGTPTVGDCSVGHQTWETKKTTKQKHSPNSRDEEEPPCNPRVGPFPAMLMRMLIFEAQKAWHPQHGRRMLP